MSQAEETLERLRQQAAEEEGDGEEEPGEQEDAEETDQEDLVGEEKAEAKKSSSRDYIVLIESAPNRFELIGEVHSSSGEAAVLSFGDDLKNGVTYVAVPMRNWTKAKPKVETKTSITLE